MVQKRRTKMSKKPKSRYCMYHATCNKDIDCRNGNFCAVFMHTKEFSSLKEDK